jgi:hypothetical protein
LAGFQVLDVAEKTSLQSVIDAYNVIIDSVATGRGHALVDLNALLETASTDGIEVQGTAYTSDFITGGVFSLDGVHPTDLGYGFMANSMIAAVNGKFGASIQLADLNQAATIGGYRLQPAAERSKLKPWVRDLRAVFDDLYGWRGTMLP